MPTTQTPSKPIPANLQKKYKVIKAAGGPLNNAMPVRPDGKESADLAEMLPNDTVVIGVDLSLPADTIKPWYYPPHGWGMIQMPDGTLFTASPVTGQNWTEYQGHFEAVTDPTPNPTPTPTDTWSVEEIRIKLHPFGVYLEVAKKE